MTPKEMEKKWNEAALSDFNVRLLYRHLFHKFENPQHNTRLITPTSRTRGIHGVNDKCIYGSLVGKPEWKKPNWVT
jgi:hypothetical protein